MRSRAAAIETVEQELLNITNELTLERWKASIGVTSEPNGAYARLVSLINSSIIEEAFHGLGGTPLGREEAIVAAALLPALYSAEDRLNLDQRRSLIQASTISPSAVRAWFSESDKTLACVFGHDTTSIALQARGIDVQAAAGWLLRCSATVCSLTLGEWLQHREPDSERAPDVFSFLNELGLSVPVADVRFDFSESADFARCFACKIPTDIRVVTPKKMRIDLNSALAHELGHAVYFRVARDAGIPPWAFEPVAATEGVAFALQFSYAISHSRNPEPVLTDIVAEVGALLRMAAAELALHVEDSEPVPDATACQTALRSPWNALDYALGRLTGVLFSLAYSKLGNSAIQAFMQHYIAPGGRQTWAVRFSSLLRVLGFEVPELVPPLA